MLCSIRAVAKLATVASISVCKLFCKMNRIEIGHLREIVSGGTYIDSTDTATKLGDNFDYPRNTNSGTQV